MAKGRRRHMRLLHIIFLVIAGIILFLVLDFNKPVSVIKAVREPVVAGTWYPGTSEELNRTVSGYLRDAENKHLGSVRALIVPHAGYVYSGQVAAEGYAQLVEDYKTVFIIGSNHNSKAPYFKLSVPNVTHYKTPFGDVKVSGITKKLLTDPFFSSVPEAHDSHVVEIQLPFLQTILSDFEIVPIITGAVNAEDISHLAELIREYSDETTLLVVSSDLSHYHPYEEAVSLDQACISSIESQDIPASAGCEACGLPAILMLLEISANEGWGSQLIEYKNSGDVSGSTDSVVGYSSIAFFEEDITNAEKDLLLKISRETLEMYVRDGRIPSGYDVPPRLLEKQGCFVTLNKEGNLRGCIGRIVPQESLYECVIQNTVNAAAQDQRFLPVEESELHDIEIEISALSVPQQLSYSLPEDLLEKLRPNVDGVIIKSGLHQSTYLPQVWEQIPDKQDFLSNLCIKGGSGGDCWRQQATSILTYQAEVWHED